MPYKRDTHSQTIILTSRQGRTITLVIQAGVILDVVNESGVYFPFITGQNYNRSVETWVERSNFLFNGVNLEQRNRKIFGIPVDQIPQGHPLRFVYPGKFR